MNGPRPTPPAWAVAAGLPPPEKKETFRDYVTRLGLNPSELLEGLTARTGVVANIRLADKIADTMPEAWGRHLQAFVHSHARVTLAVPPQEWMGRRNGHRYSGATNGAL